MTDPPVRRTRQREVFTNEFVTVYDDDVTLPSGGAGRYVRVAPGGGGPGVVLLPVRGSSVAMVRTYRYPVAAWQWALPRGFAQGADILVTARAELLEELGATASRLTVIGHVTPDSGLLASRVAVVLAEVEDDRLVAQDDEEVAEVRWSSRHELDRAVAAGEIEDGFTLAVLALATALGVLP